MTPPKVLFSAVSSVAKLINLKAIHNPASRSRTSPPAVSSVAKLINLKAIHNGDSIFIIKKTAVSSVAKLINLKAIHNPFRQSKARR